MSSHPVTFWEKLGPGVASYDASLAELSSYIGLETGVLLTALPMHGGCIEQFAVGPRQRGAVYCLSESAPGCSGICPGSSCLHTQQNLASGGFSRRHFGLAHSIGSEPS